MALYSDPRAQVKVNGLLSPRFLLMNGTLQGFPLSPILFALVLEPLRTVRANVDIKGLTVGPTEHKLSAYADYVLFHLMDPLISLPNLMRELQHFMTLSNFKIKFTKSEILPIQLSPFLTNSLQTAFPFTWTKSSLKYLGVRLTDRPDTLFSTNYPPLLTTVKKDLSHWTKTTFTWLGRLNIIKMNILPRILFYMQMIPVSIPRGFFAQLSNVISSFICNGRNLRIASRLLSHPREAGGLGLPDIRMYYQAIAFQRILDWRFHTQTKIWVSLEKYLAGRNLSYAPWLAREYRGLSDFTSPPNNPGSGYLGSP